MYYAFLICHKNLNLFRHILMSSITFSNDFETITFDKKLRVCPRGTTNISVQSVPSVPTPTTPTTPISTTQAIITNATFSISRI